MNKTNKETWDEMIKEKAGSNFGGCCDCGHDFSIGAKFAEENCMHIPSVAELIEAAKGFVRDCGCISPYRIEVELALKALEGEK